MQNDARVERLEATQEAILDVQSQQKPYLKIGQRYLPVAGCIHYLGGGTKVSSILQKSDIRRMFYLWKFPRLLSGLRGDMYFKNRVKLRSR